MGHTMTYQDGFTLPTELREQVAETSLDFLPELILCPNTINALNLKFENIDAKYHLSFLTSDV
jgi:hypothetical protein